MCQLTLPCTYANHNPPRVHNMKHLLIAYTLAILFMVGLAYTPVGGLLYDALLGYGAMAFIGTVYLALTLLVCLLYVALTYKRS